MTTLLMHQGAIGCKILGMDQEAWIREMARQFVALGFLPKPAGPNDIMERYNVPDDTQRGWGEPHRRSKNGGLIGWGTLGRKNSPTV
jgi:hypothetical protein